MIKQVKPQNLLERSLIFASFPENKVEIRDEEEPSGYIEDHINEEWDVEDDDDYSRERDTNVPKPPFVQEEKGFI